MSSIAAFQISVPSEKIQRLKQKLILTDFPDEVTEVENPWARGVPLKDMQRLTTYWAQSFDWRKAESKLNQLPQFIIELDASGFGRFKIHFVHRQSDVKEAIPLLFLHSWPGGFFEVSKLLPYLEGGDENPSFHIVAPSLVDFGFSSGSNKVRTRITQDLPTNVVRPGRLRH